MAKEKSDEEIKLEKAAKKAMSLMQKLRWSRIPKAARSKMGKKAAAGRMDALTPEERSEIASKAGKARMTKITPERRSEIARAAGEANKKRLAEVAKKKAAKKK